MVELLGVAKLSDGLREHRVAVDRMHLRDAIEQIVLLGEFVMASHVRVSLINYASLVHLNSVLDHPGSSDRPVGRSLPHLEEQSVLEVVFKPIVDSIDVFDGFKLIFPKVSFQILMVLLAGDSKCIAFLKTTTIHRCGFYLYYECKAYYVDK